MANFDLSKIKTVYPYDSLVDLIDNYLDTAGVKLNYAAREKLYAAEDWEPTKWIVIDDQIVVCYDSISGDVISTMPITELFQRTDEYLRSEDC